MDGIPHRLGIEIVAQQLSDLADTVIQGISMNPQQGAGLLHIVTALVGNTQGLYQLCRLPLVIIHYRM